MQFIKISDNTKLTELAKSVGARNVESILHLNNVQRVPNVGKAFKQMCDSAVSGAPSVDVNRKSVLLNSVSTDSDVFESVALMGESGWKLLDQTNTIPHMLKVPSSIVVPDSIEVLGNGEPIDSVTYHNVMTSLHTPPHTIDPSLFNQYSSARAVNILNAVQYTSNDCDPMQWFRVPWGQVTLHSSLSDESIQFPVYPESVSDSAHATYTAMPDMLYQYEPWNLYTSSGPRTQTFSFDFHRDMWTGDHRDGKANELIRACMANCYPMYRGSAVYTARVTLYVAGKALISGILTDVAVSWDGPLGLDNWYLHCRLDLTITEVSKQVLDYNTVRNKPLIG